MYDVEYFVNEEKKTIACKVSGVCGSLEKDLRKSGICRRGCWACSSTPDVADSFVGKAKCSAEDTFDVEKGKKIAFKRAIAKVNRAKKRIVRDIIITYTTECNSVISALEDVYSKYDTAYENANASLAEVLSK